MHFLMDSLRQTESTSHCVYFIVISHFILKGQLHSDLKCPEHDRGSEQVTEILG